MIVWEKLDKRAVMDNLGLIATFLDWDNPDPARKQLNDNYAHGGGWNPQPKFEMADPASGVLQYPGDPPLHPLFKAHLRDEIVRVYDYGYVSITQPDGTFEAARMD
jgi:hypothetical protein